MGNPNKGVYRKFEVRRTDGRDAPGEKHDGCSYFVLDLVHDKHAIPALKAYAKSCRREFPALAKDLNWALSTQHVGAAVKLKIDHDVNNHHA